MTQTTALSPRRQHVVRVFDDYVLELYRDGWLTLQIATKLDLSTAAISRAITRAEEREAGYQRMTRGKP